jgi:3-oxoadipate enol-lactonase
MPHVQVNDIDLFYDIKGAGKPLVLISGFLCDHTYWSILMSPLTKKYQVIRVDNRGIGRSSATDKPYNIPHMADDIAALIRKLGINQAQIIGHSMGGQIAQELVLAHPEIVEKLILISTWAKPDSRLCSIISVWSELAGKIDLELYQKSILPWIYTEEFYNIPGMIDMLIKMAVNYNFPPLPQTIWHHSQAIIASNTIDRLKYIDCPTQIIVGQEDILTPVKFAYQLSQNMANAELVILEKCGHGILIESPEILASTLCQFLN